jgi:hypothetical protein
VEAPNDAGKVLAPKVENEVPAAGKPVENALENEAPGIALPVKELPEKEGMVLPAKDGAFPLKPEEKPVKLAPLRGCCPSCWLPRKD